MHNEADDLPLWQSGDFTWVQDAKGSFRLKKYRDRDVHPSWPDKEAALLAYAATDAQGNRYPDSFNYSPTLGAAGGVLKHAERNVQECLPPFAQRTGNRPGIAETDHSVALDGIVGQADVPIAPARRLSLPSRGRHHFLVGNLGLAKPLLVSYDIAGGEFYCWQPDACHWKRFVSEDRASIGTYGRPDLSWSMHVVDALSSGTLFVPTDDGLAKVTLNALALTYRVEYVGLQPCIGGIIQFQNDLFVLVQDDATPKILRVRLKGEIVEEQHIHEILGLSGVVELGHVRTPFRTAREVYWFCSHGQIRVKANVQGDLVGSIVAWPPNVAPRFNLGGPYLHSDGSAWQQCIDKSDPEDHFYCFIEIGKASPDRRKVGSYRLMASYSCIAKGQRMVNQPPWDVPSGGTANISKIIVPLLESTADSRPMVCFSAKFNGDPDDLFAHEETIEIEYVLWGHVAAAPNHYSSFHFTRAATPWDARIFIYEHHLFIYDPDSSSDIAGWKLIEAASNLS